MNSSIVNFVDLTDLPIADAKPARGFAAQIDYHIAHHLDLNQYVIKHPVATFFMRARGPSMQDLGILDGDLLVVDRAVTPVDRSIVIVAIGGRFLIKCLRIINGRGFLYPANKTSQPLATASVEGLQLCGVVTHAIHDVRTS